MQPTIRLLSLLVLLVLSLSTATDHSAVRAASCPTTTTLRVTGWDEPAPQTQLLVNGFRQFTRFNPCILVHYSPTASYQQEIQREFAGETEPDVFNVSPDMIATEGRAERLLKLDPYLVRDNVSLKAYTPALLKLFQVNGATYGLPKDWGTDAILYNKDIFAAKHVPYPSNNLTYAQYRELAKLLTTRDPKAANTIYGTMMPATFLHLMPFLYGFGTRILDPISDTILFDNAKAIQALDYYTRFQLVDGSATVSTFAGETGDIDSFGKGKVAMVIDGSWLIPYLRSVYPHLHFGVAEIPIGPAGRAAPVFTNAWSASARTAHPVAAAKLIAYLAGPIMQARQMHLGSALPTLTALQVDPYIKAHPDLDAFFAAYTAGKPTNFGQYNGVVTVVLGDAVAAVLSKQVTPAQAIARAARTLQLQMAVQP